MIERSHGWIVVEEEGKAKGRRQALPFFLLRFLA